MTSYRRDRTEGATWFFTLTLADRRSHLLVENVDLLRAAFRYTQQRHPWQIDAIVILPDHLHAICTLPEGDADYALRWRLIKTEFSRAMPKREAISASRHKSAERGIWQRRYWEHRIRDDADFARHVDYIHFNPCKHGHVLRAEDWRWSSLHRYVRDGLLAKGWGGSLMGEIDAGE
ncbi:MULTISPECIES: REP-associated tyrosine transposase [Pseudomonas]|uniref:REP-associated tyrosine transposase n=1 Tax=Pseudomonas nitroreducens TaxID=46680 RepID=UPI001E59D674|nr:MULTISPECIES: transposase [Pseudomonas]MCE4067975.1 transposase [Pseudomonas nitritireducens]MCE4077164.1 transposase [Pseudomonas nitroreducens]